MTVPWFTEVMERPAEEIGTMRGGTGYEGSRKRPLLERMMREIKAEPQHKRARRSLPRSLPSSNHFVRAVGSELVEYRKPVYEWERADDTWKFWWEFIPLDDISMRDKDPEATFHEDKKRADETIQRLQRKVHAESTLVPMFVWQLEEQPYSIQSIPSSLIGSETDEQQYDSEISSPKLRPWLLKMQRNGCLISTPVADSIDSTFIFNAELHPDIYVGSQPSFEQTSYLPSANLQSLSQGDLQEPLSSPRPGDRHCMSLDSGSSHRQYLDKGLDHNELQQNMQAMQSCMKSFFRQEYEPSNELYR